MIPIFWKLMLCEQKVIKRIKPSDATVQTLNALFMINKQQHSVRRAEIVMSQDAK